MAITVEPERGTIRALRETQKGGELTLMTIYVHTIRVLLTDKVRSTG